MKVCPKCKKESLETVEIVGFNTFLEKCFSCGYEVTVHAHFISDEERRLAAIQRKRVIAFLAWDKGRPTAKEIVNIRKVVLAFRDLPLNDLLSRFGSSSRVNLGECSLGDVERMRENARGLGIHIDAEDA